MGSLNTISPPLKHIYGIFRNIIDSNVGYPKGIRITVNAIANTSSWTKKQDLSCDFQMKLLENMMETITLHDEDNINGRDYVVIPTKATSYSSAYGIKKKTKNKKISKKN